MTYASVGVHRSMVFDETRNLLYAEAIRKFVTPESIVLDLGAGLGIHGLIAAAAGARRVYLVEREPVLEIAKEAARANGLGDRVVALEGDIEDVQLPEQVDLLVSVFVGNLLFTEDLLPWLFLARERHLKPNGRMIPDRAELWLAPVFAPEIYAQEIDCWSKASMGVDLSVARKFAANEILWPEQDDLRARAERLADGAAVTTVDLMTAQRADCLGEAHCRIRKSNQCHGLLGWVRMRLGDQWLSTDPYSSTLHWSPAILPIDPPLLLEAEEDVLMSIQRPARGDWTWMVTARLGTRRHSNFFAHTDGLGRLRRIAPEHRPGLSTRGLSALRILELMRDGHSNRKIAQILVREESRAPSDLDECLLRVQALAMRYGSHD